MPCLRSAPVPKTSPKCAQNARQWPQDGARLGQNVPKWRPSGSGNSGKERAVREATTCRVVPTTGTRSREAFEDALGQCRPPARQAPTPPRAHGVSWWLARRPALVMGPFLALSTMPKWTWQPGGPSKAHWSNHKGIFHFVLDCCGGCATPLIFHKSEMLSVRSPPAIGTSTDCGTWASPGGGRLGKGHCERSRRIGFTRHHGFRGR